MPAPEDEHELGHSLESAARDVAATVTETKPGPADHLLKAPAGKAVPQTVPAMFLIFAGICVLSWFFCYRRVPETKGVTLSQISAAVES